ncbi:uncharacterized protein Z520_11382 [Fonsecaea multimorphosa CBS 102226]|uniref:Peptidase S54 rhomboid domain-containing protein n=1 Tax=Fonsecaea multimorphosa CBS 102226 TaxID=1442371 RepID=A0A0D2I6S1_9EURO|nr:uncharacterized protein Z520_11382 [Fonsecaea multimorphosa CBS 102226]KIX92906.1 hypothetical protein Z520_11382 [Fonsecaea multimorphosa CBS 102226]
MSFASIYVSFLLLLTLVNAAPFALQKRAISQDLFNELSFFEQYSAAAYCPNNNVATSTSNITCAAGNCPLVQSAGAESLLEFQNEGLEDATGFVAVDHTNQLIVMSFRGTTSFENILADINLVMEPWDVCDSCTAHSGFLDSWQTVKPQIQNVLANAKATYPSYQIISTGHSLGGAVATLAAADLRSSGYDIALYTYGSPMTGNYFLATFITNQSGGNYRVTHAQDLIPKLPGYPIFAHVSPEYWITSATNVAVTVNDIQESTGVYDLQGNQGQLDSSITDHGCFRQSPIVQKLKPYGADNKPEKGLKFQDAELSREQILSIFGRHAPPTEYANRLLRILHGRRHDGTLDLPLPKDVESQLGKFPHAVEDGLRYLRQTYPIDEDEAILYRIEREEDELPKDHPSVLMQRGQDIGLYRAHNPSEEPYYGPQSGHYQAELSEKESDPYGRSELDRIRAENEAKREQEEAELQAQIDNEMEKLEKIQTERSKALAARPEQGLETAKELRPPNSFERWVLRARNRAQSKLTLESPEIAQMTMLQRLFPSLLLVALLCGGSYLFAQAWTRPKQSDRLFPAVSLSFATIGTLIAINTVVWLAWKFPPCWSMLNKYFLFVPAYPYALSMLGNLFSHQTLWHLTMNMGALAIFGLPLHEEIGRGNFLSIYFTSGLIGGFVSFARHVAQRNLATSVLGASGCVYGIISAYLALHSRDNFSLIFIPHEWTDKLSFNGQTVLVLLTVSQVFGALGRLGRYDYIDHLGGMAVGYAYARWLQSKGHRRREDTTRLGSWWTNLVGKKP